MKSALRKILSVVLLLWAVNAIAQQQVQLSQFFADYTFFNPAFAGRSFQTDATIIHREQWVGLNGAPSSTLASVNTRIPRSTLGAGLNVFNDVIGNFRTVGLRLAIGSEKRFGLNSVRFALAPSFYSTTLSRNFNPADDVSTDPTLQKAGISASNFDLNLGLLYQAPDYFVGISVVNLLAPRLEQLAAQNTRTLFVTGGVEFRSSPIENLRFLPTFLIKTDLQNISGILADINVLALYKNAFFAGLGYRMSDAVFPIAGYQWFNSLGKFRVGYAYDYTTTAISTVANGTHEITLNYSYFIDRQPIVDQYKNVRFL